MREGEASETAGWVAAARTLGRLLPRELILAEDPHGLAFAPPGIQVLAGALTKLHAISPALLTKLGALSELLLWMQLRTRFIDDLLLEYLRLGGRQVVLLGAGYDARSQRFQHALRGSIVYEIDHPATQGQKRARLPSTPEGNVRYVPWDFEANGLAALEGRLCAAGLDPSARTLTIWEGVTMYLSEQAIDESMRCVRQLGGDDSLLVFNYIEREVLNAPKPGLKTIQRIVRRAGEPYQFGFAHAGLPTYLRERGFSLVRDVSDREIANEYWPLDSHRLQGRDGRRIAIARRLA